MKNASPKPPRRSFAAFWNTGESDIHHGPSLHAVAWKIECNTADGRHLLALIDAGAVVKPDPNAAAFRFMCSKGR